MLAKPELAKFPSCEEWRRMWETLQIRRIDCDLPAVDAFLDQIRKAYQNGDVLNASFLIEENDVFDFLVYVGNYKFLEFPERLFGMKDVARALPALKPETMRGPTPVFEPIDPFALDGHLARWLYGGGAYSTPDSISPASAKQFAQNACEQLFGDRYNEIAAFASFEAWSDFFCAVAWDHTFVLLDKRLRHVQVICATDTD